REQVEFIGGRANVPEAARHEVQRVLPRHECLENAQAFGQEREPGADELDVLRVAVDPHASPSLQQQQVRVVFEAVTAAKLCERAVAVADSSEDLRKYPVLVRLAVRLVARRGWIPGHCLCN